MTPCKFPAAWTHVFDIIVCKAQLSENHAGDKVIEKLRDILSKWS